MSIVVGTNSWATEAEANTYFAERLGASGFWVESATDNPLALITAYREIVGSGRWSVSASTTASDALKQAQYEHALYLLVHEPDRAIREGLQTQLVVEAGVVKEKYGNGSGFMRFPPIVESLLRDNLTTLPATVVDTERDEEQLTTYNAVSNLPRDTT